jgi:hypothetical protein
VEFTDRSLVCVERGQAFVWTAAERLRCIDLSRGRVIAYFPLT